MMAQLLLERSALLQSLVLKFAMEPLPVGVPAPPAGGVGGGAGGSVMSAHGVSAIGVVVAPNVCDKKHALDGGATAAVWSIVSQAVWAKPPPVVKL